MEELNAAARNYFDILAQIEELQSQAECLKDTIKAAMVERTTEELRGEGWSATWHNTVTSRFDSKAFRAEHADLYAAFTVKAVGTRFTLQAVKA